jgi:hypothetical protein
VKAQQRPGRLEGVAVAEFEAAPHRLLGERHGLGRVLQHRLRDLERGRKRLRGRLHQLVDQPQLPGARGGQAEVAALQRHAQRGAQGQALGEAHVLERAHHADVDVGVHELRVAAGHHDVGVHHEVEPPADTEPLDGADHRLPHAVLLRRPVHRLGQRSIAENRIGLFSFRFGHVEAGAEVPLTSRGDDGDANVGVVAHLTPDGAHEGLHVRRQRISAIGTIQPDDGDAIIAPLVADPVQRARQVDGGCAHALSSMPRPASNALRALASPGG